MPSSIETWPHGFKIRIRSNAGAKFEVCAMAIPCWLLTAYLGWLSDNLPGLVVWILICVALTYAAAIRIFNTTFISADATFLRVSHGPLPYMRAIAIRGTELTGIRSVMSRSGEMLIASTRHQRDRLLANLQDRGDGERLAARIAKHFRVAHS